MTLRNGVTVPLYLDQDQLLYAALGLGRRCSLLGVHMIDRYATKLLHNEAIPPVYRGDDIFLMGGDFIIDNTGLVVYQYATEENERPTVEQLLEQLI